MRILAINSCLFGSTGKIMHDIASIASNHGHQVLCCGPKTRSNQKNKQKNDFLFGSIKGRYINSVIAYLTGLHDWLYVAATLQLIHKINKFKPDIIHLHNLHGDYLNLAILFRYLKKHQIPIVWTLHDCWIYTGHCCHYFYKRCDRWQSFCYNCPSFEEYPRCKRDDSQRMFRKKKEWFTAVEKQITLVPVSHWLEQDLYRSFMKNCLIKTIHNGIDLQVFRPLAKERNLNKELVLRKYINKYPERKLKQVLMDNLNEVFIVMGCAMGFDKRKGYNDFIKLSTMVSEDVLIVMVGVVESQMEALPENILGIPRTYNQDELVACYSIADIVVNPTYEDNYPTVNLEAISCGTPVLTYRTGGSIESISHETGFIVEQGDIIGVVEAIKTLKKRGKASFVLPCRKYAEMHFEKNRCFESYMEVYNQYNPQNNSNRT